MSNGPLRKALAIIVGAGPGTGAAVGRAFSKKGYAVALLARSKGKLNELSQQIRSEGGTVESFPCDVVSEDSVKSAFNDIKKKFPGYLLRVAVFNSSGAFHLKPFLESKRTDLESGLNVSVLGAFSFAQASLAELLSHDKGGSLIFTGATASLRGGANLGCFAAGKFGLRALSQSLAREFGPKGVHVAHVIVDGMIDGPTVTERFGPAKNPDSRLSPDSIAAAYVYLHEQDKTCWTQELDVRPCHEKF
ncbi:hypothetical protein CROQUDRAFT_654958 [Cronartium quercuum f. sp. fusiforme G11]|uniref:Uncharacterized protein n=1 Tax=Cronartium quercuum f. sp. fusiforme G11 TaxID=708437 RepID=A0A9P6NQL1_9BASI|nr:hypothetical protein CROQUDRAFT_654958 [Cronartium quercuum f. sp. fusiforme G11]